MRTDDLVGQRFKNFRALCAHMRACVMRIVFRDFSLYIVRYVIFIQEEINESFQNR